MLKCTINAVLILLFTASFSGCTPEPIHVGFAATLSGKHSAMGLEEKNGVILAVEEINSSGGIKGRPLVLHIKDDKNSPETARQVVSELIETGAEAMIGHMTSAMTLASIDTAREAGLVMISPTTSTDLLSHKDDIFFRMVENSLAEARHLGKYAASQMNLKRVAGALDSQNEAYTRGWMEAFREGITEAGGTLVSLAEVNRNISFTNVTESLLKENPDGIALAMGPLDAALICQQIRKQNSDAKLFLSGWSKTPEFIQHGGKAVEGAFYSQIFAIDDPVPAFRDFQKKFSDRFGYIPDFAGAHSYEAVLFLKEGLLQQKKNESLKESLSRIKSFEGLQGTMHFNTWGDVQRDRTIIVVKKNSFTTADTP